MTLTTLVSLSTEAVAAGAPDFSLGGLWGNMGLFAKGVVVVMLLMSLLSVFVVSERMLHFKKSKADSEKFVGALGEALKSGNLDAASELPFERAEAGYLGRTLHAGLTSFVQAVDQPLEGRIESVARALERQGSREVAELKTGLGLLASVASSTPFIGLLGTVMGIVTAFQNMAASGSGGLGSVSAGIAEALVTTAFGLLVAIPALLFFNYLQGWVDSRQVDIAESSNELLDLVARKVRAQHGR